MRKFVVTKFATALTLLCATAIPSLAGALEDRLPTCLACHGEKGQSEMPQVPSLGAQSSPYVLIQLYLFRENQRHAEPMNDMAKGLTDADLQAFADHFAKMSGPKAVEGPVDQARLDRGRALVNQNHCNSCHNPDFSGHDNIPRLAHQREDYVAKTLREYKNNTRAGYDATMAEVVEPLKDADFDDLAYFLARNP